jgi:NDP-sugar pyrophosphorylase family protein
VTIVGPTSIGSGCVIDSHAVITRSVIWSDCRIGRAAFVDRCILADGAKVEPELVVRETVWLPANRQPLGLLDRISPFRTLLPEKVKRLDSGPLPAAFDQASRAISSNH